MEASLDSGTDQSYYKSIFNKKFDWRGILPNATRNLMFLFSATEDRHKNGFSFNNEY